MIPIKKPPIEDSQLQVDNMKNKDRGKKPGTSYRRPTTNGAMGSSSGLED